MVIPLPSFCVTKMLETLQMSLTVRKLNYSDKVRLKLACSATEASRSLEISAIESRDITLSKQRTTKELIRLRRLISAFVVRI